MTPVTIHIDKRTSGDHLQRMTPTDTPSQSATPSPIVARVMSPVILLHPDDNVLVCRSDVAEAQLLSIDGHDVPALTAVGVGHKIARRDLAVGDRVSKYGALIGSMTVAVVAGEHVHLHNMKSDYIATHTREAASGGQG